MKLDESVSLIHLGLCKLGVKHTHRTFLWCPPTHHRSLPSARTLIVPFSASIASTVAVQKWAEACKMNERDEKGHIVQQKRQWSRKISQYPILHHYLQFNINSIHIREPHPIPQFLTQHSLHTALWQHRSEHRTHGPNINTNTSTPMQMHSSINYLLWIQYFDGLRIFQHVYYITSITITRKFSMVKLWWQNCSRRTNRRFFPRPHQLTETILIISCS